MDVSDKESFVHNETDQSADISAFMEQYPKWTDWGDEGKVIIVPINGPF